MKISGLLIAFCLVFSAHTAYATSGACSDHLGVDCKVIDTRDASVICNDGWADSAVLYQDSDECNINCTTFQLQQLAYEGYVADDDAQLFAQQMICDAAPERWTGIAIQQGSYDWSGFQEWLTAHVQADCAPANALKAEITKYQQAADEAEKNYGDCLIFKEEIRIKTQNILASQCLDLVNGYKGTDGQCYCNTGYQWNSLQNKCTQIAAETEPTEENTAPTSLIFPDTFGSFSDIGSGHQYATAIAYLKKHNVISGYADNSFKPDNQINRAELMKILIGNKLPGGTYENCFKDVKQEWFAPYICYAKQQGWVSGYADGTFKPSQTVNRAEAIKMALEVFEITPIAAEGNPYGDVSSTDWFAPYVQAGKDKGLFDNTWLNFSPSTGMTRGLISDIIYRLLAIHELGKSKYEKSLDSQMIKL